MKTPQKDLKEIRQQKILKKAEEKMMKKRKSR